MSDHIEGHGGTTRFGDAVIQIGKWKAHLRPGHDPFQRKTLLKSICGSIGAEIPVSPYFCAICERYVGDEPQGKRPLCPVCREDVIRVFGPEVRYWATPQPETEMESILRELP